MRLPFRNRCSPSASDPRWPQAGKHTQWPGTGKRGDPALDAFNATQVAFLADQVETQRLALDAGAALLGRIGPAVLMTHSQAGTFGWLLGDARPALVKAIIALELAGPPFENAVIAEGRARIWDPADLPLAYDPPAASLDELAIEQQTAPDHPDVVRCRQQERRRDGSSTSPVFRWCLSRTRRRITRPTTTAASRIFAPPASRSTSSGSKIAGYTQRPHADARKEQR